MVDNSELILDDKKYLVVDTIEANNVKYVYFVDDDDDNDFPALFLPFPLCLRGYLQGNVW